MLQIKLRDKLIVTKGWNSNNAIAGGPYIQEQISAIRATLPASYTIIFNKNDILTIVEVNDKWFSVYDETGNKSTAFWTICVSSNLANYKTPINYNNYWAKLCS